MHRRGEFFLQRYAILPGSQFIGERSTMRLTRDQVEAMSQRMVRSLVKDEMITMDRPEAAVDVIANVFTADLEAEDRLNDEVHELLKNYSEEISRGMINYQDLFRKVKSKMARDRKMVI